MQLGVDELAVTFFLSFFRSFVFLSFCSFFSDALWCSSIAFPSHPLPSSVCSIIHTLSLRFPNSALSQILSADSHNPPHPKIIIFVVFARLRRVWSVCCVCIYVYACVQASVCVCVHVRGAHQLRRVPGGSRVFTTTAPHTSPRLACFVTSQ